MNNVENSVDYLAVVCGKNFILNDWSKYILSMPTEKYPGNLIVVDNCTDSNYQKKLFTILAKEEFRQKFNTVNITLGPGKFKPKGKVSWRDPSINVGKHDSTADAFNIGFSRCQSEWVVTIDDDTFVQPNGVEKLIDTIIKKGKKTNISCVTGLYFTKVFDPNALSCRVDRNLVLSIEKERWVPVSIDTVYNKGLIEVGFCGTGAAVWKNSMIKRCPPTRTITGGASGTLGPDAMLCRGLTELGQRIMADTTVLAEHWGKKGKKKYPVGFTTKNVLKQQQQKKTALVATSIEQGLHYREETINRLLPVCESLKSTLIFYWIDSIPLTKEIIDKYSTVEFKKISTHDYKNYKRVNGKPLKDKEMLLWFEGIYKELLNTCQYKKIYNCMPLQEYTLSYKYRTDLEDSDYFALKNKHKTLKKTTLTPRGIYVK